MQDCKVYGYIQMKKSKWKRQWLELAGLVLFVYENKEVWYTSVVMTVLIEYLDVGLSYVILKSGFFSQNKLLAKIKSCEIWSHEVTTNSLH